MNANDFRSLFATDIWILKQLLILPSDPPPKIYQTYDEVTGVTTGHFEAVEYVSLPLMQEAVRQYRSLLAPVFFALAQKVYAEIFRVFLGQNGRFEKGSQFNVQQKIEDKFINSGNKSTAVFSPAFHGEAEFDDWWQGKYHYQNFRLARNKISHAKHDLANGSVYVKDNGTVLLNWGLDEVLSFVEQVAIKASRI